MATIDWSKLDETAVCEFIMGIEEIPQKYRESACEQVRAKNIKGSKLQQCASLSRCQDFFSLPLTHCQTLTRVVKEGHGPSKTPAGGVPAPTATAAAPAPKADVVVTPMDVKTLNVAAMKVDAVKWISGGLGSTGVFMATTEQGTFVAKPVTTRTAGELYAGILLERLGIAGARMVLPPEDEQEQLLSKLRWAPMQVPTDRQRLRNERIVFMSVIEFVPGAALPAVALTLLAGPRKAAALRDIGRVMGFDMIVNNFDRLPLCWFNDGNPDNLMVSGAAGAEHVVAIDHTLTCIKHAEGKARYLQALAAALSELAGGSVTGPALTRVRASMSNCTGYQLTDEDCTALVAGVREAVKALAALQVSEPNWVENIRTETAAACGTLDVVCGLPDLDAEFLASTVAAILGSSFGHS